MTAMLVMTNHLIREMGTQKYNLPQVLGHLLFYSICSVSEAAEVGGNGYVLSRFFILVETNSCILELFNKEN